MWLAEEEAGEWYAVVGDGVLAMVVGAEFRRWIGGRDMGQKKTRRAARREEEEVEGRRCGRRRAAAACRREERHH